MKIREAVLIQIGAACASIPILGILRLFPDAGPLILLLLLSLLFWMIAIPVWFWRLHVPPPPQNAPVEVEPTETTPVETPTFRIDINDRKHLFLIACYCTEHQSCTHALLSQPIFLFGSIRLPNCERADIEKLQAIYSSMGLLSMKPKSSKWLCASMNDLAIIFKG